MKEWSLFSVWKSYSKDSKKEPFIFAIRNPDPEMGDIKQIISDETDGFVDLRTLKRIEFPEGEFHTQTFDEVAKMIFFDGHLILFWDNEASSNYPEDLIWERDISELVSSARKLERLKIAKELMEGKK